MAYAGSNPYLDPYYDMRPLSYPAPPPPAHSPVSRFYPSNHSAGYHSSYYHQHPTHFSPDPILHLDPTIKTLFISGLPDDIMSREIYNLFSRHHGFESFQLKQTGRGNQAVAFATFTSHQSAVTALGALDKTIFDPDTRAVLHIELARSNSRKRSRDYLNTTLVCLGSAPHVNVDKHKIKKEDRKDWSEQDGGVGYDEPLDTENDNSRNKGAFAATQSRKVEGKPANGRAASNNIPPCSTLFIANLGPACAETELKEALSKFSGFLTLKMKGKFGMPVAFADFEDIESSTAALEGLKGTLLDSPDFSKIHIEFARSKMKKN